MSEAALATSGGLDPAGPESMLRITPVAAAKVNEIRSAEAIEGNMALRLRVVGGGCAAQFGHVFHGHGDRESPRLFRRRSHDLHRSIPREEAGHRFLGLHRR